MSWGDLLQWHARPFGREGFKENFGFSEVNLTKAGPLVFLC